jgi:hypothetical protein
MRGLIRSVGIPSILLLALAGALLHAAPASADDRAIVIVYKNGHRQSLSPSQVSRIDIKAAEIVFKDGHKEKSSGEIDRIEFGDASGTATSPSRNHFIGKWEVGEGNGSKFLITLEPNGDAKKTLGEEHGTWTWVDGEARISWDDGWHDAIRKVGAKHEKVAHEPGKSFEDPPSNVTTARNTEPRPI